MCAVYIKPLLSRLLNFSFTNMFLFLNSKTTQMVLCLLCSVFSKMWRFMIYVCFAVSKALYIITTNHFPFPLSAFGHSKYAVIDDLLIFLFQISLTISYVFCSLLLQTNTKYRAMDLCDHTNLLLFPPSAFQAFEIHSYRKSAYIPISNSRHHLAMCSLLSCKDHKILTVF